MEVKPNMPNAKVLSEKQAIVAQLTEKIQNATAGVLVDYKGITVEEDTALRRECRENDVDYAVVKNTLLRFAFNNAGLSELDGLLPHPCQLGPDCGDHQAQSLYYLREGIALVMVAVERHSVFGWQIRLREGTQP